MSLSDRFSTTPLRWLYVDFNSYFASVEQQRDPRLRGKPVIVVPVMSDATCAIAASYEAKAYGIKTNTNVGLAKKICPGLICVTGSHDVYVEYHHKLIDEIDRHLPVSDVCSIDEMACRLMNNEMTPQRLAQLAAAIKQGIARNVGDYLRCSIGVAQNRYLAKIATDMQKPDGFTVLTPDILPERLARLELRDLPGIGANMEKRLHRAGIYDMPKLLSLPPKHLRAVWGNLWGEKIWYLLRGHELPEEESERRSIGHSHVLSPEHRPPDAARHIGRRLTQKAASRLRRMGYTADKIHLSLRLEDGGGYAADAPCRHARDSFTFLAALEDMWQALIHHSGRRRIKKVSVTFTGLAPEGEEQPDLFATPAPPRARPEKLSEAIDALNHKFGRDTVSIGPAPVRNSGFGTKVAFNRIPDIEEFVE